MTTWHEGPYLACRRDVCRHHQTTTAASGPVVITTVSRGRAHISAPCGLLVGHLKGRKPMTSGGSPVRTGRPLELLPTSPAPASWLAASRSRSAVEGWRQSLRVWLPPRSVSSTGCLQLAVATDHRVLVVIALEAAATAKAKLEVGPQARHLILLKGLFVPVHAGARFRRLSRSGVRSVLLRYGFQEQDHSSRNMGSSAMARPVGAEG